YAPMNHSKFPFHKVSAAAPSKSQPVLTTAARPGTCPICLILKSLMNDMLPLEVTPRVCLTKNSVLFTDTECLVLSFDIKLPDASQVLLRVPRENNMYNVNLKNIIPSGDLTCLFVKGTLDESNLWHRRLGHVNFKTINKLVKGNLVRNYLLRFLQMIIHVFLVRKANNTEPLFCGLKGIKREFSIPRTPQQNGKFQGKVDEEFLVGYSAYSKAFRVFNSRTRIVQETLHVNFMENKPNVAGVGPAWLFDIDSLTRLGIII
nr:ribonuclease H-like domain-containing protein [Tanacetum cinerariifolium]